MRFTRLNEIIMECFTKVNRKEKKLWFVSIALALRIGVQQYYVVKIKT